MHDEHSEVRINYRPRLTPQSVTFISFAAYMTDWHSPSIILAEYRASFLSAKVLERLNFTL